MSRLRLPTAWAAVNPYIRSAAAFQKVMRASNPKPMTASPIWSTMLARKSFHDAGGRDAGSLVGVMGCSGYRKGNGEAQLERDLWGRGFCHGCHSEGRLRPKNLASNSIGFHRANRRGSQILRSQATFRMTRCAD